MRRLEFRGGPHGSLVVSASGGILLKVLRAAAAIPLLALVVFGAGITLTIPETPYDAMQFAEEQVGEPDGTYTWLCPDGDSYRNETLVLEIPKDVFEESMSKNILRSGSVFASAPVDLIDPTDPYVQAVADHIMAVTEGCTEEERAAAALCFVQSAIRYTSDADLYGTEEFWTSPVETLYLHRGDCEDTSVLLCSIYGAMGIRCVLLDYPGHEAVGVILGDDSALDDYLFCETSGDSIRPLGWIDPFWSSMEPEIHIPGDDSEVLDVLGHWVAGYRYMIQRVTGA